MVGPSIIPPNEFFVVIVILRLFPTVFAIILPISNLTDVPEEMLTGLLTVYFKIEPDTDSVPLPIPIFSISLVAEAILKSLPKFISTVFIVPVVAVVKKMS
jgi:hypothetical protein